MGIIAKNANNVPKLLIVDANGYLKVAEQGTTVLGAGSALIGKVKLTDGVQTANVTTTNELEVQGQSLAKGQTMLMEQNYADNATESIHIVPAGKTFYLCGGGVAYNATADNATGRLQVDTPVRKLIQIASAVEATYKPRDTGTVILSLATPVPYPAATEFEVYSSHANLRVRGWIIGWEEDA